MNSVIMVYLCPGVTGVMVLMIALIIQMKKIVQMKVILSRLL